MNQTYEQYLSSRQGLILDYHDKFSDRVVDTLSQYVPEEERDIVNAAIRSHRKQMHKLMMKDEERSRYPLRYLDLMNNSFKRKEEHPLYTVKVK